MAHTLSHLISPSSSLFNRNFSSSTKLIFPALQTCRSSANEMSTQGNERPRFKDFPYTSAPIRELMVDLVSMVENRLESQLLQCTLPHDVEYFTNPSGTSHGSLFLRSAASPSPIDFIFASWLHCQLPTGAALNITSLVSYMNDTTDAPQLLIELIQSSPTNLVIVLDLPPRRDLVLHPEYLKTFYEDSGLEKQRQLIYEIPEVQPYISPMLYIRCLCSPTAILVSIDTSKTGGENRLEDIVSSKMSAVVKEVLGIWFDLCVSGERKHVGEADRAYLKKRDSIFKEKSIEIDIGANLPRMFGQETADRILLVLRNI